MNQKYLFARIVFGPSVFFCRINLLHRSIGNATIRGSR
ncbi:hypothetical protein RISK_006074 [Rhodopirellula islandica]|uniref:Uncharacterized protein n=1 Tax=Rhodopirellula islandica TaxID=595434 RepID=A0A0J1B511_RHOIS|nr:hypothetical protein RISK_006074 [Rhodopirellula islandica]